ncbi:MAG: hypothetical protein QF577_03650 [Phycisphaerae bacterium]|nr:hypothetical protein [Phycisphaerae bacterium]
MLNPHRPWKFSASIAIIHSRNYLTTPGRPPKAYLGVVKDLGRTVVRKLPPSPQLPKNDREGPESGGVGK